jgi:hypothetical protein
VDSVDGDVLEFAAVLHDALLWAWVWAEVCGAVALYRFPLRDGWKR